MDSPTERMPIACVHCAKAKAKCDKKVPCTRCVTKQIICQSRATRRSSQQPPRRLSSHHRQSSDTTLQSTAQFHVGHLPTPPDGPVYSPNKLPPSMGPRHMSLSDSEAGQMHLGVNGYNQDMDSNFLSTGGMTSTPPDINIPITPILQNMPGLEDFVTMSGGLDHDGDNQFLSIGSTGNMDFDLSALEFTTPSALMHGLPLTDSFNGTKDYHPPFKTNLAPRPPSGFSSTVPHTRSNSPCLTNGTAFSLPPCSQHMSLQEPDAVIAGLDCWPMFKCNPLPKNTTAPKTAKIYLEGLAQTLRSPDTWNSWSPAVDTTDQSLDHRIVPEPIVGWSREKLIAITQGFLHKALDIHKAAPPSREGSPGSPDSHGSGFLMLPPPNVIQYFLRTHVLRHEPYYACDPAGVLDPNELMQLSNSKASSLLVLLMVAQGASATPSTEARYLSSGLTEACRISLFDIIEKDVYLSRDPLVLRSALLFVTLAAWSGDKWHMDIANGQIGMYLAMLNHGGLLEPRCVSAPLSELRQNLQSHWLEWKEQESRTRLAHAWVFVDQELSLFSDTPPLLSVVNLNGSMPDGEMMWQARSAPEWLQAVESIHGSIYKSPLSVCELFSRFVDGELGSAASKLSPIQLRLLLHPLQALVCQLRQFLECLPDGSTHGKAGRAVTKVATKARLEEVSALLQQWYDVSKQCSENIKGMCWTTCANLILYHLICLNAITSFSAIEQFARRESSIPPFRQSAWLQNRCVDHPEEALFHCGQVLRLVQTMPEQVRPPWWAGAVYRVALVAWVTRTAYPSMSNSDREGFSKESNMPFAIDAFAPEHPSICRYLKYQEGIPTFTKRDGSAVSLEAPIDILSHCCDILESDATMRLTDGIRSKIRGMIDRWRM